MNPYPFKPLNRSPEGFLKSTALKIISEEFLMSWRRERALTNKTVLDRNARHGVGSKDAPCLLFVQGVSCSNRTLEKLQDFGSMNLPRIKLLFLGYLSFDYWKLMSQKKLVGFSSATGIESN